ncbi:hypothetical protein HMPREF0975_01664 [Actinomyces sp. oral taxon 849 str. F0330]|uniref:YbjN domain-containing protein n=1 Tax=Actinomyces sp. oral taxon 849 TaxID=653385 RepID=UPI00024305BA|nr:YbjN domain-containing protein [Actinomyces sp. oral taxon 849]EHM94042.1 hypothetical protein HMPREF0975_01664 [Actinomyces sp. oral taxon 849 str. F0330]
MPRLQRLTDFIARLLGKEWDVRALDQRSNRQTDQPGSRQDGRYEPPVAFDGAGGAAPDTAPRETGASGPPAAASSASTGPADAPDEHPSGQPDGIGRLRDSASVGSGSFSPMDTGRTKEATEALTLARIESMLTGPMEYNVQLADDREHPCLLGTWDSFPFVIEIPEGHDGWLLVSGDWEEAAPASQRDEIAASVNDWNRDKFFPTVGVVDTPIGPLVRATYLTDLSAGVTDAQLRLHLDTALSACTQALSLVGPLLPEI